MAEPGDGRHAGVLDAVRAHVAAFNAADLDRVLATLHHDAVLAGADRVVVGRRALREVFAAAFAGPERARLELREAVVAGSVAACEMAETVEGPEGRVDLELAAFFTVSDGRLARIRVYRDLPEPGAR